SPTILTSQTDSSPKLQCLHSTSADSTNCTPTEIIVNNPRECLHKIQQHFIKLISPSTSQNDRNKIKIQLHQSTNLISPLCNIVESYLKQPIHLIDTFDPKMVIKKTFDSDSYLSSYLLEQIQLLVEQFGTTIHGMCEVIDQYVENGSNWEPFCFHED